MVALLIIIVVIGLLLFVKFCKSQYEMEEYFQEQSGLSKELYWARAEYLKKLTEEERTQMAIDQLIWGNGKETKDQ